MGGTVSVVGGEVHCWLFDTRRLLATEGRERLPMTMMDLVTIKHNGGSDRRVSRMSSMAGAAEGIQYFGLWLKRCGNPSILAVGMGVASCLLWHGVHRMYSSGKLKFSLY